MTTNESIHEKLNELAYNMWWAWHPRVFAIFRDLDRELFRKHGRNPVAFLKHLPPEVLVRRTVDTEFHARVDRALRQLQRYLSNTQTWSAKHCGILEARPVAYFSAEFGIHESLPIYSGGLGILAGDHIKSASDLGLPLWGVGLFYREGYFRQRLDEHGWQISEYLENDPSMLPVKPARISWGKDKGKEVFIAIDTREGTLHARVWEVAVGRSKLILLDSNVEENTAEDRDVTARLYGGDRRTRIRQELLLGVGGLRALFLMGVVPSVLHLNEGHSAFVTLEAARQRMVRDGLSFADASRFNATRTVFTTHTPVEAGHDRFDPDLVERTLGPLREELGLSFEQLMALGRVNASDPGEPFNMTVLALKLSRFANGVSSLHGGVSRNMWQKLWPNRDLDQVPIGHITNGVHVQSWLAPEMHDLYNRHFTPQWPVHQCAHKTWRGIEDVEDEELWETHRLLKVRLVAFVRDRLKRQLQARHASEEEIAEVDRFLDPEKLLIGFARRFAVYKRADLLFRDLDRLARLVSDEARQVQFVFAGKAHPQDVGGKELLQSIIEIIQREPFRGRIVFLEDHDMNVGRHLVQGVDVWLNTPRRPMEACGTSGQKCLLNGVLNMSILDGWWPEAYDGKNGFAIGDGGSHVDRAIQDQRDHDDLFDKLENEVIPLFYDRENGIPRGWVRRMKRAIRTLGWKFNTDRMVMNYAQAAYLRAAGGQLCNPRRF